MILGLLACRPVLEAEGDAAGAPWRWNATLQRVVTEDGLVDYERLRDERQSLDDYVAWLALPARQGGRIKADRHAMWINAYNALTLFQVLERDLPGSVLDVEGWLPMSGSGFFLETTFVVGGQTVSLSDIEHEKLRLRELDLRDHAALNCASASCPPLRAGLYPDDGLNAALDEAMARWVDDDARGVRIEGDQVVFSPIFEWYARDFASWGHGRSLCGIAADYASGAKKAALQGLDREGCAHRFGSYDWSLNRASR